MRRLAGDDPEVNEEWITDKDRFAHRYGDGEDRLTRPLVRDGDVLRPASWPEAIDVAVRGLQAAGTLGRCAHRWSADAGGRVRLLPSSPEPCWARTTSTSARGSIPARRPTSWPTPWPEPSSGVTFADLENASSVLLVCLEPEEEAGMIFLRLRKAFRKKNLTSWTLAPYASNGARKMGAQLIACVPGDEAAVLDQINARG